ncbi:hypothetical protein OOT46_25325 [Aquabacterium sp. A7-Y]|uniref:hypothetical protein n=1 Tax=Aquabacterium sp. A7-Y TaxID=1349605 RepID=UPI00223E2055|nr:hypothetical protein [Aquabacterium sp. A7-Y]MCW7541139.1 hypothetical protein [Aquabacterium sp. A7-Y]
MKTVLLLTVACVALVGCASSEHRSTGEAHAAHHPSRTAAPALAVSPAAADQQMKMMQEMHQKMRAAKTPEERQALMAEHMKAMQAGMSMMCEMGQDGMGSPRIVGTEDKMKRCMDMKDMTMKMMMDREAPNAPTR